MTDQQLKENRSTNLEHIEGLVGDCQFHKLGKKTTVCLLTMNNGFEIVGTSGVVDAAKYDAEIGNKIAKENAIKKVWEIEGYRLQCLLAQHQ